MKMTPLISILIATKNRQRYCLSAVKSILALDSQKIQVVVQDNSDEPEILKNMLLPYISDSRLIYHYTPPPFSSIDNFNAAIELATGEYVCLIGDDDGINPEIIKVTEWAKCNNIECLTGSISVTYRWDNVGDRQKFFIKLPSSSLMITKFTGEFEKVNLENSLEMLMSNGCANFNIAPFPKLYHGIVLKKLLDEIKTETGSYLKGLSPDIYAAVSLAFKSKKFIHIDYPLTMPGVCAESTSITEGEKRTNSKKLSDAPHLKGRKEPYQWEKNVPEIYCVHTIWADSAFAALREFDRDDLIAKFDDFALAVNILSHEPSVKDDVYNYLQDRHPDLSVSEIEKMLKQSNKDKKLPRTIKENITRIKRALKLEEFKIIPNLHNMEQATLVLTEYLANSDVKLGNSLSDLDTSLLN